MVIELENILEIRSGVPKEQEYHSEIIDCL